MCRIGSKNFLHSTWWRSFFGNYNATHVFHAVSHLRLNVTHSWTSKKTRHSFFILEWQIKQGCPLTQDDQNFKLKSQTLPSYPSRHLKYFSSNSSLHPWNLLDQNIHPEVSFGIFSPLFTNWFSNSLLCKKTQPEIYGTSAFTCCFLFPTIFQPLLRKTVVI